MPLAKANGIALYYEVHGKGEPLLMIMGLGANATNWDAQIPALSREYRVIVFDNRGAGRSEKPLDAYSMPQMADDAAALLDKLQIASAHVFGMSMGGMIAQELVLRHPGRVRSLVLGATMAGGSGAVHPSPATIQQFVTLAGAPMAEAVETGLGLFYSEAYIAANRKQLIARAMKNLPLMAPAHALQKQAMAVLSFNAQPRLRQIGSPTLLLHGTSDRIVPFPNSAVLLQGIAGSRLIDYPGAGHGFIMEHADAVNAAVLEFLRSRTPAPTPRP
jgi:pimeloyl-ACP methyl ester carboxylesterase